MTFSYVPADRPAIWMQFVPADKDSRLTEEMVHSSLSNEKTCVDAEEKYGEGQVSTVAEKTAEKTAGPHIPSVDEQSQLTECEYHRDCISVGKEQADHLTDNFFDSLILTTTTDRGRDAVVVEMRKSADQSGSPVDCLAVPSSTNNLPKELRSVAEGSKSDRLRCPKMERMFCPPAATDKAYSARTACHKKRLKTSISAPVSRPGCRHDFDEDTAASCFSRHATHGEKRGGSWHEDQSIYLPSFDFSRGHLWHVRSGDIDCFSVSETLIRN